MLVTMDGNRFLEKFKDPEGGNQFKESSLYFFQELEEQQKNRMRRCRHFESNVCNEKFKNEISKSEQGSNNFINSYVPVLGAETVSGFLPRNKKSNVCYTSRN